MPERKQPAESSHGAGEPSIAASPASPTCPVCLATHTTHFLQAEPYAYWRCAHCQATFVSPEQLPTPEAEHAEYRLHQNQENDAGYRQFLSRLVAPLLAHLPPAAQGLDYGCGPGPALAAMLTEAGHRVALFDPLFFNHPQVLAQRYDFITCTEVAEHFHRPAEEFQRLDALLKPGGVLALMTRFQTSDAAFAGWHYRRDPTHVVFYREHTLRAVAQRHQWDCLVPCANVVLMFKRAG